MRYKLFLLLAALPCCVNAGYTSSATITFAPASSATVTNITLAFSGANAKLKTVANGGQIRNTVIRVGVTVPADFVLTTDSKCNTITGYSWGIDYYDGTNGIVKGWVLVPGLTTGASVVATVCIGNSAVSAYEGGARGAEFDSYTQGVWHMPNGTTLSLLDFSANGNDGTVGSGTPAAATGKIDGGMSNNSNSYVNVGQTGFPAGANPVTLDSWVYYTSYPGNGSYFYSLSIGIGLNNHNLGLAILGSGGVGIADVGEWAWDVNNNTAVSLNTWHKLTVTCDGTNVLLYLDGVLDASGTHTLGLTMGAATIGTFSGYPDGNEFVGSLDEVRIDSTSRSASWIATEYANQNSPPSIGAFTSMAIGGRLIIF